MNPELQQFRLDTPLGPLSALVGESGLRGLWFDAQRHHPGALAARHQPAHPWRSSLQARLDAYFAGQGLALDGIPLDPQGTVFQRTVWMSLLEIPPGHSRRYGELARQLGRPQAARALGAAVGRNPISILIPCHRVLGSQGRLTGYAGGLARKQALLRLEGAHFQAERVAA